MTSWIRDLLHQRPPAEADLRRSAIKAVEAAHALMDHALSEPSAAKWLIGRPFVRFEQARVLLGSLRGSLAVSNGLAAVNGMLDRYEAAFNAIAALQRSRGLAADAPTVLDGDARDQIEFARGAAHAVLEGLAGPWASDCDAAVPSADGARAPT